MEKTKTKKRKKPVDMPSDFHQDERETQGYKDAVWRQLCNMKHRDLQRECILRGLPFDDVVNNSHTKLVVWFYDNYNNSQNDQLLLQYDNWMEGQLKGKYTEGKSFLHPSLRFSYVEPIAEGTEARAPKVIKEKEAPKAPREKNDDWGINTGTKKYLTYELTINDGLEFAEIVQKIKEQYPDAEDKSIKIWYKRALAFKK